MKWEELDKNLYRTIVPGGWLVKHEIIDIKYDIAYLLNVSICFVPDPDHNSWIIIKG